MTYIVDIIIIAVFLISVVISYKKGFFRSLFDLIGTLVSVMAARLVSATLATQGFEMLIQTPARAALTNSLGTVGTTDYGAQVESALNSIPDSFNGIMSLIGIDKNAILEKVSSSELAQGNLVDNIMENIVAPVGTAVIRFVLFVILAVVFTLVLKVVVKLLDFVIKKLPFVKSVNKGLGIVIGVLRGLITVLIVSMLIATVVSFTGNEEIIAAVNNSVIVSSIQNLMSSLSGAVLKL
ncbi:MAG: CvpA family protein [Clostridia bacterium]|nr:CvpA family protein [Clostridia bacterium]